MNLLGSLAQKAGNLAGRVYNNVNNDVVKPVQRDVVQPVRNAKAPLRRLDQTANNYATNMAKGLGTGLLNLGEAPAANLYAHFNPNNAWAQQQAAEINAKAQGLTAPILRTVPEVATTLAHPLRQFSYHPDSKLEQALFGKTPVQNIQKKVANNYNTHQNLPEWKRLGLSGLEAAGSVAQDAPVVGAAGKIAKVGDASLAARGIELNAGRLGMSTKDVSLKPRPLPVSPVPSEADQLIQQVAQEYKNPDHFISDTASGAYNLDKSLKGGIQNRIPQPYGQDKMFRSTEHTPFYSDFYAKNGKAPTLKDYHAAVTKEFKSGRPNVASQGEHAVYQVLRDRHITDTARALQGPNPLPGALTHLDTPEIINARQQAAAMPHTIDINTPERAAMREQLAAKNYGTGAANKNKRLDLVIGPPAAGKSSNLVDPLANKYGSIVLDSDAIKEQLPEFNNGIGAGATHKESAHIADYLMSKMAMRNGDNIVAPRLGKNADAIKEYMDLAKKNGYEVHLHSVVLPSGKAAERAVSRFHETGRFVDPHYILSDVANKPEMVYNQIKNEAKTYGKHSTDVQKGESAKLLEQSPGYEQPLGSGRAQHQPGKPGDARAISGKTSRQTAQKSLKSSETAKVKAPESKAPISSGGKKPPTKAKLPSKTGPAPGEKLSRFANKTVQRSPEVSAPVKKLVKEEKAGYIPHNRKSQFAAADEWMKGKSNETAFTEAIARFEKGAEPTDQDVINAIALAKKLDASGKETDQFMATELFATASKTGSTGGQLVQAFASLNKRTPQGLHYAATKTLQKAGVELTPEIKAEIKAHMDEIKKTAEGSDARELAAQKLVEYTNQKIPRTKLEAGIDFWRAGLLTGPETVAKIASSHLITSPMELINRPFAAATDKVVSAAPKKALSFLTRNNKKTAPGQRTVTFNPSDLKDFASGYGRGTKAAGNHLKTGLDAPRTGGFGHDFGTGHKQTAYERTVYRVHGSVYKPFYSGAYKMEEANQRRIATAQFGKDADKINEYMQRPETVKEMQDYAAQFAMQNKTAPGELTQTIQHFKPGGVPIGQWIAPFSRIPAALGVKGIVDYTPIGTLRAVTTLVKGVTRGEFDQRKFVESLSKSAIGGTGLVASGALLMHSGRMTLQEPTDPKEKALWEAQGKTRNSIKIGNKWVTLNAFGPVGIALGIGGAFDRAWAGGSGGENAIAEAVGSGAKLLADQPYMKGVTGVGNVLQDPVRYAGSYVRNSLTSFIPAGVQQTARGTDKTARAYPDNLKNAVKAAFPGSRESLPAAHDIFGTPEPGAGRGGIKGGILGTTNPLYPSDQRNKNDVPTQELQRLYDKLGSADAPAFTPPTSVTLFGNKIKMSKAQQQKMIGDTGPVIHQGIDNLLKNSDYKALDDQKKSDQINTVIRAAHNAWVAQNADGEFNAASLPNNGKQKTLSATDMQAVSNPSKLGTNIKVSGINLAPSLDKQSRGVLSSYSALDAAGKTKYLGSSKDAEYKYAQAKYNNDAASGTLSQAADARAQYSLGKDKIGSSYDKNVRDLYSLNKTELYGILNNDPKGQDLAAQILQYGDQLESGGYGNNKFRDSKGNVSIAPKSRTAAGSSRKTKSSIASTITAAGALNRKIANAKVKKANFTSKVSSPRGILAYKKPGAIKNLNPKVRRLA